MTGLILTMAHPNFLISTRSTSESRSCDDHGLDILRARRYKLPSSKSPQRSFKLKSSAEGNDNRRHALGLGLPKYRFTVDFP